MKDYNEIMLIMEENKKRIEKMNADLMRLTRGDELRRAACDKNVEEYKAIKAEVEKTTEEQIAISEKIKNIALENKILENNLVCAIYASAMPVIISAFAPYEGKQYGEKTKEKIYETIKKAGFSTYFGGYSHKDQLCVRVLGSDGCYDYRYPEVKIYANYNKPFITSDNKINMAGAEYNLHSKYIDDIPGCIANITTVFEYYKIALEKAIKAESALNNLLPNNFEYFHYVNNCNRPLIRI